jgi:hypothetical protein
MRVPKGNTGAGSSRQGHNPVGASPTVSITRFGHVAIPHLGAGNQPSIAWGKRPGCLVGKYHTGRCNLEA